MKKIEWKKTEELVEYILTKYPFTRDSDDLLNAMIIQELGYELYSYADIMMNRKKYGIPSFATIERCRRKLQSVNEKLRANKEKETERFNLQNEYTNYAIDKVLL